MFQSKEKGRKERINGQFFATWTVNKKLYSKLFHHEKLDTYLSLKQWTNSQLPYETDGPEGYDPDGLWDQRPGRPEIAVAA